MIQDIGNNQSGLAADTSGLTLNGVIQVPPGGILPSAGFPVSRNLVAQQGGYLSQFASIPGLGSYASGDQFVPNNSPLAGYASGIVVGPPAKNGFLIDGGTLLNTANKAAEVIIARKGLTLALVGAANGGTAIAVGSTVGKSAVSGASAAPFLQYQGAAAVGSTAGLVASFPIFTALTTAVGPGSTLAASVWNTTGISTVGTLIINPGGANQETVSPSAVSAQAPAVAALAISGTAGSASTVQLTFNLAGYNGSTGVSPSGTATTTFTVSVPIPSGSTATVAGNLITAALLATGFTFGAPQNIFGINSGTFSQTTGAPASGPLFYVTNSAGTLTFSAAMPGAWANTLLSYTVTVLNGTTQTYNTAVAGSATPVQFSGGATGTFTATFQNAHVAGEFVVGLCNILGTTVIPVPGTSGMQNVGLAYVDLFN
jgi:hypothetical protein